MPPIEPQGDANAIRTLPLTLPTGSAPRTDVNQKAANTLQHDRAPVRPKYAGAQKVYGAVDRRKATEFLRDKNDRYSLQNFLSMKSTQAASILTQRGILLRTTPVCRRSKVEAEKNERLSAISKHADHNAQGTTTTQRGSVTDQEGAAAAALAAAGALKQGVSTINSQQNKCNILSQCVYEC
jgi:hypothetical protein